MMAEHDSAGEALATLRRLTRDYQPPAGATPGLAHFYGELEALDRDLREHIRLEDDILFPRAIALE
jgi:regulator of cell morphogenesis and NO signaling